MPSIMDFFRSTPAPTNQPTKAGDTQGGTVVGADGKPIPPAGDPKAGGAQNTTVQDFAKAGTEGKNADGSPKNPLDSFKGMYDNVPMGDDAKPPVFALDPKALETAASSLKFSSHVTPELAAKLQSGDPVAIAAAFDAVGRQVYQTVMSHQSTLTNRFVDARLSHDRKGLGQSVHSVLTANSLAKLAENNPTLKEHVQEIGDKIASKYPDATPDWIADQTKNYFVQMAKQLDPSLDSAKVDKEKKQAADINWEDWINAGVKN